MVKGKRLLDDTNLCSSNDYERNDKMKALFDANISHDDFVLINNVLKEYDDMKEEVKTSNNK